MLSEQTISKMNAAATSICESLNLSGFERDAAVALATDLTLYLQDKCNVLLLLGKTPAEVHRLKMNALAVNLATMNAATEEIEAAGSGR